MRAATKEGRAINTMHKKQIFAIIFIFIIVAAAAGWFYYFKSSSVNYLIPGVPYNGFYNLFFERADSTIFSSIKDVLGYWGDERYSTADLKKWLASDLILSLGAGVENFFKNNGYEIYSWSSADGGKELEEIKKFVNEDKKVPVIVYQKLSLSGEGGATGLKVVIGIFDSQKKIIVHDHNLGNNYEISYADFEKMFGSNARAILAVWPSDKIKKIIKGPDYSRSYFPRTEIMNNVGHLLVDKKTEAYFYISRKNFEKANLLLKEMSDDADFQYFPRAFQIWLFAVFADTYAELGEYGEAINVLKNRALPLNYDIKEAPAGWVVPQIDKLFSPYIKIAEFYFKNNERKLALDNYNEAKKIVGSSLSEADYQYWFGELEKELKKK